MNSKENSSKVRVLLYPNWSSTIQYIIQLEKAVNSEDITYIPCSNNKRFFILSREAIKNQVSVVHIHWIISLMGANIPGLAKQLLRFLSSMLDVWFLKFILRKKLVWTVHNLISHECYRPQLDLYSRKKLSQWADQLIAHGHIAAKAISETYGVSASKIEIIPHGNFIEAYPNQISKEEATKRLKIGKNKFTWLFFGNLRKYKGLDHLINLFKTTPSLGQLIIAGKPISAAYKLELENQIESFNNIYLYPHYVADDEIQIYMKASDAVVLPFTNILTSGSLILAMSFHKPIVTNNIQFIRDYIDEKGAVFYDNTSEGLLKAMQQMASSNLEELSKNNFNKIAKLDWTMIGHKHAIIYKKLSESASVHIKLIHQ